MSIMFCEKHSRRWDSDNVEECPLCENEHGTNAPLSRSRVALPEDYRARLEASNLPIDIATAIADQVDAAQRSETVPQSWIDFSIAAGETPEGIAHRALVNIASISPLSTAAPQEIARTALKAAHAFKNAAPQVEAGLHTLAPTLTGEAQKPAGAAPEAPSPNGSENGR